MIASRREEIPIINLTQWLGGGKKVSPVQQELQIWTGGALNIFELIGMNSTFLQILGKFRKNKMSKFSFVLNPLTSQKLARCSRPLSHRFG